MRPVYYAILCGIMLFAAWPVSPLTFFIFIAFVPLLHLSYSLTRPSRFFLFVYLAMLIWNIGTTWWTCKASLPGGISAMLANSLLMALPWLGFFFVKRRQNKLLGQASLVVFWLTFEYIHLHWDLSWPWLTLGNAFATHPNFVQWYSITGTSGGSLWVLLTNILLYNILAKQVSDGRISPRKMAEFIALLIAPCIISIIMLTSERNREANSADHNIVLVQPNIDPWDEKFVAGKEEAQLQKLIRLSESKIDSFTTLVIWPETAIPVAVNEDSIRNNWFVAPVWDFLRQHPRITLLTGMEGFRLFNADNRPADAQLIPNSTRYAESYNSAVMMDSGHLMVYHKSRLVPGAEIMPSFLHFLDSWFEKFGGTVTGYTGQKERTVLPAFSKDYIVAPAVCYESIYGEFMASYVHNGANLIAVITNDGWWGNTAGYRQHENYARLRAIETHQWVVRSANTGISCFIDPAGEVREMLPWNVQSAIKMKIPTDRSPLTYFARFGDIISKMALAFAILAFILHIATGFKIRRSHV